MFLPLMNLCPSIPSDISVPKTNMKISGKKTKELNDFS